jgi:hypothetical protein
VSLGGRPSQRALVVDHAHGVRFVDNPDWPKQHGRIEQACHDGSPAIQFQCSACGATSHMHETQLAAAPAQVDEVGMRCSSCRQPMIVSLTALRRAFDAARQAMEPTQ